MMVIIRYSVLVRQKNSIDLQVWVMMVWVMFMMLNRVMVQIIVLVLSIRIILLLQVGRLMCIVCGRMMCQSVWCCDMLRVWVVFILLIGIEWIVLWRILVIQVVVCRVMVSSVYQYGLCRQGQKVFLCIFLNCVRLQQMMNSCSSSGVLWKKKMQVYGIVCMYQCCEVWVMFSGRVRVSLVIIVIVSSFRVSVVFWSIFGIYLSISFYLFIVCFL